MENEMVDDEMEIIKIRHKLIINKQPMTAYALLAIIFGIIWILIYEM